MRRYQFLSKDSVYSALNKLRTAFLAAKDGSDVEEIIKGILTNDERLKIGRRIEIAELLQTELTYEEIAKQLKVGKPTVIMVANKIKKFPKAYELINKRKIKVEKEYKQKAYKKVGGPKLVFKKKAYTGFTRKNVKR